jgi:hypothetical protein
MRRPRADRGEKRVTHGNDMRREEQLDPIDPNQRGLSAPSFAIRKRNITAMFPDD